MLRRLFAGLVVSVLLFLTACKQVKNTKIVCHNNENSIFKPVSEAEAKEGAFLEGNRAKHQSIKKIEKKKLLSFHERQQLFDLIKQQEAKLSDIPVLLNAEPIIDVLTDSDTNTNEIVLGYKTDMLSEDVIRFYAQEMERLGWKATVLCSNFESLLHFVRPGRFCTVSIRLCDPISRKDQLLTKVFIFTGPSLI